VDEDRQKLLDESRAALLEVGNAFHTLMPGITANIPLNEEDPTGPYLGFMRINTVWQLVYRDGNGSKPEPLVTKPIRVRLAAMSRIPDLYNKLCLAEETQIDQLDQAVTNLRAFTASILEGKSKP
jgi:hypothetical protein